MRLTEYDQLGNAEERFHRMATVRKLRDCTVSYAGTEKPLLVLVEHRTGRTAVFEYDTDEEREQDADLIRKMCDDEDGEAGAGCPTRPAPPGRGGSAAASLGEIRY